jgi:hypothetical protein
VRLREGQALQALLYVLFKVASDLFMALLSPLLGHGGGELESGASVRRSEDPT